MNVPYQVGETVDIALYGAVIRDVGVNYLDLHLPDGANVTIDPESKDNEIRRALPAGGEPQKGDVWQDSQGNTWFAVRNEDRYGNHEIRLTRDGDHTYEVAQVHRDYVLVKRLFRAEPEPDHGLSPAAAAELERIGAEMAVDGGQ